MVWQRVLALVGLHQPPRVFNLPVAGIDDVRAQSIYFMLRMAQSDDEQSTATKWLEALQITQVGP